MFVKLERVNWVDLGEKIALTQKELNQTLLL